MSPALDNKMKTINLKQRSWLVVLMFNCWLAFGGGTNDFTEADRRKIVDSFAWGTPTNGIQMGVRVTSGFDPLYCEIVMMRIPTNNFPARIVPPDPNEGLHIELHDKAGNLVKKTSAGKSLKELAQNATRYDYNSHNSNVGRPRIYFPTSDPFQLYHFGLKKYLNIEEPGLYHLTVSGGFYMIDNNGKLIPFQLLPVSTDIQIRQIDVDSK
jgi:hypothetical protein